LLLQFKQLCQALIYNIFSNIETDNIFLFLNLLSVNKHPVSDNSILEHYFSWILRLTAKCLIIWKNKFHFYIPYNRNNLYTHKIDKYRIPKESPTRQNWNCCFLISLIFKIHVLLIIETLYSVIKCFGTECAIHVLSIPFLHQDAFGYYLLPPNAKWCRSFIMWKARMGRWLQMTRWPITKSLIMINMTQYVYPSDGNLHDAIFA
jgi:hypothetical protein